MSLSVKVASLTCLMFTGGICWLVSQVSAPILALPAPAAAGASPAASRAAQEQEPAPVRTARLSEADVSDVFETKSPAAAPAAVLAAARETVVVPLTADESEPPQLPPLHVAVAGDAPQLALGPETRPKSPDVLALPSSGAGRVVKSAETGAGPVEADRGNSGPTDRRVLLAMFRDDGESGGTEGAATSASADSRAKPGQPAAPTQHVVVAGESISKISRHYYGSDDARAMRVLVAANPQLKKQHDVLYAGQKLTIPPLGGPVGNPTATDAAAERPLLAAKTPSRASNERESADRVKSERAAASRGKAAREATVPGKGAAERAGKIAAAKSAKPVGGATRAARPEAPVDRKLASTARGSTIQHGKESAPAARGTVAAASSTKRKNSVSGAKSAATTPRKPDAGKSSKGGFASASPAKPDAGKNVPRKSAAGGRPRG